MSISINAENIEIIVQALNKTKKRVKKLEKKTVGVNEDEKNYNIDDSLERLFVITNGHTTRLDEIEERINGFMALLGINEVPENNVGLDGFDQLIPDDDLLNGIPNDQRPEGGKRRRKRKTKKKRKKKRKKTRRKKKRKGRKTRRK